MESLFVRLAAINGFVAVALGAFGAHGLKSQVTPDLLAVWQTGTQYHLTHALALFLVGLLQERLISNGQEGTARRVTLTGWLFVAGILIFSGSLYALVLSGVRWLGAITPLGGVCFLTGWAILALQGKSRAAGTPL